MHVLFLVIIRALLMKLPNKVVGVPYLNPRGPFLWRVFRHFKTALFTDNSLADIAVKKELQTKCKAV